MVTRSRHRPRVPRWRSAAAVCAAVALVGAGCGSDDDDRASAGPDGVDGCTEETVGGSVTMSVLTFATGFDPTASPSTGFSGGTEHAALYDTLMRYDPETLEYEPKLAESLEPNDDFTEWTLTLRPGITFGNGDPLTAESVVASIERHRGPDSLSVARRPLVLLESMEVVDDLTVRFTVTTPWATFPWILSGTSGQITNQAVVDERGDDFSLDPTGAGVGPYELESFSPDEEVVFRAKDDYWDGPVCLEELRFVPFTDAGAALDSFLLDETQVVLLSQAPEQVAEAIEEGVEGHRDLLHGGPGLMINSGREGTTPATADPRVRQAVAAAIDVEVIDERAFGGAGRPTTALVHPDSELSPAVPGPDYDPALATDLVDEAKADGWDGSIELVVPDTPAGREAAIAVEGFLEAVGMSVQASLLPSNEHITATLDGDFELSWWALQASEANLWDGLAQFRSDVPTNYGGYQDPAYDALLDDLLAADSVDATRAALADLQEYWNENVPMVFWASSEYMITTASRLQGLVHDRNAVVHFGDAYLEG